MNVLKNRRVLLAVTSVAILVLMLIDMIWVPRANPYTVPERYYQKLPSYMTATDRDNNGGTLLRGYCNIYNTSKPAYGSFECVPMRTEPATDICIYSDVEDVFISHDLRSTGKWEPYLLKDIQDVLHRDPQVGFIDIGANIGYYALIAAKMGHRAVAVEPYLPNIQRLHKSMELGGLKDYIKVLHNAMSDKRGEATIVQSGDNQGDHRIVQHARPCGGSCPTVVNTIVMDDLLEVISFDRAVLKIDIQGFEHKAFVKCEKFLTEIYVSYIFMEWQLLRHFHGEDNSTSLDKTLVEHTIALLYKYRFRPFSVEDLGSKALDPNNWGSWPIDVVWRRLPHPKEYQRLLVNHYKRWP